MSIIFTLQWLVLIRLLQFKWVDLFVETKTNCAIKLLDTLEFHKHSTKYVMSNCATRARRKQNKCETGRQMHWPSATERIFKQIIITVEWERSENWKHLCLLNEMWWWKPHGCHATLWRLSMFIAAPIDTARDWNVSRSTAKYRYLWQMPLCARQSTNKYTILTLLHWQTIWVVSADYVCMAFHFSFRFHVLCMTNLHSINWFSASMEWLMNLLWLLLSWRKPR